MLCRTYPCFLIYAGRLLGGEGGIRTLEGLLTLTPLAGERFRPLSHLSVTPIPFERKISRTPYLNNGAG
jgi:hypothetical protein